MREVVNILMRRDELSFREALNYALQGKEELMQLIAEGASIFEIETFFEEYFGLEMDYFESVMQ